ncbi:ribosome recycling factor, partial [Phenoliferia sp. Uapishka_3]
SAVAAEAEEEEVETKQKGKKGKGKGKALLDEADVVAGGLTEGAFDLEKLDEGMVDVVGKLRVGLKTVVGRVGRVTPALLDSIRVESEGRKSPLAEFATVSVKDGKDLLVTVYEESSMKAVSQALYDSPLSLTPQAASATSFRVPVPRPDWDKRQQLVRQAQDLCESARVSIRAVRGKGQKEIKSDVDAKLANKEEGRADTKKLDAATKKRTDEVDAIFEQAKKVLMDE